MSFAVLRKDEAASVPLAGPHPLPRSVPRALLARLSLASLLALGAAASLVSVGLAEAKPSARVAQAPATLIGARIEAALRRAALGTQLGISVRDLATGEELAVHNGAAPLRPASNLKLVTAAACLAQLGPDFRMKTALLGKVEGDTIPDGLFLKGYGDPTLHADDFTELAHALFARGVRRVSQLVIDGSYFDDAVLPPGFDEQPQEFAAFRAGVAALSVDENAYTLRVEGGRREGEPAHVVIDASPHLVVTNHAVTSAQGPAEISVEQATQGDKLAITISGTALPGREALNQRRRIESPLGFAGATMLSALQAAGIDVVGGLRFANAPAGLPELAVHSAAPLADILRLVGKNSNNFVAEMLLKVLAAERSRAPGSSEHGAAIALETLQRRFEVPIENIRMLNGSGLFGDSRISPSQLTALLARVYADASLRTHYVDQLAIGGADGTLAQRLRNLPQPRIVHAKTGTLDDVIALSGYVLGRSAERAIAFSLLFNGVHGRQPAARALADQIVRMIADSLWKAPSHRPKAATRALADTPGAAAADSVR